MRVLNRSTNNISQLTMTWERGYLSFPPMAPYKAQFPGAFGAPHWDTTIFLRSRIPEGQVIITYLTPGLITNRVVVPLAASDVDAVRFSRSNFMFVVNSDRSITSTVDGGNY